MRPKTRADAEAKHREKRLDMYALAAVSLQPFAARAAWFRKRPADNKTPQKK